ncbi:MAG: DNA polymerase III subunit beta [Alphaproteobacteria bacterium]|nr:DNA polymerase III subunit beta [Alphaproteobacteria bacterium]
MRAKVSLKDILPAVMRTVSVADKKSIVPILSHVLMDFNAKGLTIQATDLDHSIVEQVSAEVDTFGSLAVPAGVLGDILRKVPNETILEFSAIEKGDKLLVTAGRFKFELSTLRADDFPVISRLENTCRFLLNASDFNKLISRTKFSISPEESRHNLNGIFIHKKDDMLKAASTDGHRLSVSAIPLSAKESIQGVIVARKTVFEIKKLLDTAENDVVITFSANQIQFEIGNILFISKLVDGNFPDYTRVIPAADGEFFTVKRSDFVEIIDRVAVISDDKVKAVKLGLSKNSLSCYVANNKIGSGQDIVDVKYDGKEWSAGFNASYLLDIAQTLQGDELKIYVKESLTPILIIDPSEPESLFVVMPMRI